MIEQTQSGEARKQKRKLVHETRAGVSYSYCPIGQYIVRATGVCGGRPTFKGTRIEVKVILDWLRIGRSLDDILQGYPSLCRAAIEEAIELASRAFAEEYGRAAA